jgi:hypothetical protein
MLAALVLSAGAARAAAPAGAAAAPGKPASASLERLKTLAGEWVAAEDGDEMVTVYHADGPDLVLTHYCLEGNQPRMRAKGAQGSRFDFRMHLVRKAR